jgi:hypothetical protein
MKGLIILLSLLIIGGCASPKRDVRKIQSVTPTATAFDVNFTFTWNQSGDVSDMKEWELYAIDNGVYSLIATIPWADNPDPTWVGTLTFDSNIKREFVVQAINNNLNKSGWSNVLPIICQDNANCITGLVPDVPGGLTGTIMLLLLSD